MPGPPGFVTTTTTWITSSPTSSPSGTTGGVSPTTSQATKGSTTTAGLPSPSTPTTTLMTSSSSTPAPSATNGSSSSTSSDLSSNRTLIIILAAVLSSVGVILIAAAVLCCRRYRRGRIPFFNRGITPIDDDEIETWKISPEERDEEKRGYERGGSFSNDAGLKEAGLDSSMFGGGPPMASTSAAATAAAAAAVAGERPSSSRHTKGAASTGSAKKAPAAVIVYQSTNPPRRSEDFSPRSFSSSAGLATAGRYGRMSLDKDLPQTPVQARAPNARAGLTDEAIPGDEPFLPTPKRQPSRISKMPPLVSPKAAHTRSRGSRGSMRSFVMGGRTSSDNIAGDHVYSAGGAGHSVSHGNINNPYSGDYSSSYGHHHYGSQHELSRASSDYPRGSHSHRSSSSHQGSPQSKKHGRVYSSSSIPPRLSFSDDYGRPSLREDIGLAIG